MKIDMLEVHCYDEQEKFMVGLTGMLTASTAPLFEEALQQASLSGKKQIVLDCAHLTTLSGKGIGLIMSFLPHFEHRRVTLTLLNLCPIIFYNLNMLGMTRYLEMHVKETL